MPDDEPLQVDEVVSALYNDKECSIVHPRSSKEVALYFAERNGEQNPWHINSVMREIPDTLALHQALAMGFVLSSNEYNVGRGPERGTKRTLYRLDRSCFGVRAAAIKALQLVRVLPGVASDAWLWVTTSQYDDRDYPPPEPPVQWPPLADPKRE